MGRQAIPSGRFGTHHKHTVLLRRDELGVAKHGISMEHWIQHQYPHVYVYLCVVFVFIHFILTHRFIVCLPLVSFTCSFLSSPLHSSLPFIYLFCFFAFFHPTSRWPNQNSHLIRPVMLSMSLLYLAYSSTLMKAADPHRCWYTFRRLCGIT